MKPSKAHKLVAMARRTGTLEPEPCEECGNESAQAHHDDYDKPLAVRWLCLAHHRRWHAKNEPLNADPEWSDDEIAELRARIAAWHGWDVEAAERELAAEDRFSKALVLWDEGLSRSEIVVRLGIRPSLVDIALSRRSAA